MNEYRFNFPDLADTLAAHYAYAYNRIAAERDKIRADAHKLGDDYRREREAWRNACHRLEAEKDRALSDVARMAREIDQLQKARDYFKAQAAQWFAATKVDNTSRLQQESEKVIDRELQAAYKKHGASAWGRHEFYGILAEEVAELLDAIRQDLPTEAVLSEAAQIACVCRRYMETGDRYRGPHVVAAHPEDDAWAEIDDVWPTPSPTIDQEAERLSRQAAGPADGQQVKAVGDKPTPPEGREVEDSLRHPKTGDMYYNPTLGIWVEARCDWSEPTRAIDPAAMGWKRHCLKPIAQ